MSDATDGKICYFCGEDCAGQPRGKDPEGRYFHKRCLEAAKAEQEAAFSMPPADHDRTSATTNVVDDDYGLLGDMIGAAEDPAEGATNCPQCSAALALGTVLCTNCGYNFQSGAQLQSEIVAPPPVVMSGGGGGGSWPVAIGIISIVWAVGGIVFHFVDKVVPLLDVSTNNGQDEAYAAGRMVGGLFIPLILGVWLLLGAMRLLRRDQRGASMIKQWAVVRLVLGVVCNGIAIAALAAVPSEVIDDPRFQDVLSDGATSDFLIGFLVVTLLVTITYPIFILIWFSRDAVKSEMKSW